MQLDGGREVLSPCPALVLHPPPKRLAAFATECFGPGSLPLTLDTQLQVTHIRGSQPAKLCVFHAVDVTIKMVVTAPTVGGDTLCLKVVRWRSSQSFL